MIRYHKISQSIISYPKLSANTTRCLFQNNTPGEVSAKSWASIIWTLRNLCGVRRQMPQWRSWRWTLGIGGVFCWGDQWRPWTNPISTLINQSFKVTHHSGDQYKYIYKYLIGLVYLDSTWWSKFPYLVIQAVTWKMPKGWRGYRDTFPKGHVVNSPAQKVTKSCQVRCSMFLILNKKYQVIIRIFFNQKIRNVLCWSKGVVFLIDKYIDP